MDVIVGFGLLGALIAVIALFARLFGSAIAGTVRRAAKGDATGADVMAALTVIGMSGSDGGGYDVGGGGGCD